MLKFLQKWIMKCEPNGMPLTFVTWYPLSKNSKKMRAFSDKSGKYVALIEPQQDGTAVLTCNGRKETYISVDKAKQMVNLLVGLHLV